ncbi:MAG: hypothetical protein JXC32_11375 [Anaerolineae bacterium]|nr:hypothetical protein [Anaerolineae bacterium]
MTTCKDCVAKLLGACHGDFCRAERVGLEEEVARLAAATGHTLSELVQDRGRPVWRARCRYCGREIAYTLDPEPGEPVIFGPLLDATCEHAPDDDSSPA